MGSFVWLQSVVKVGISMVSLMIYCERFLIMVRIFIYYDKFQLLMLNKTDCMIGNFVFAIFKTFFVWNFAKYRKRVDQLIKVGWVLLAVCYNLLIGAFVHSLVNFFWFIGSPVRWFVHLLVHSFILSLVCFVHCFIHSLVH